MTELRTAVVIQADVTSVETQLLNEYQVALHDGTEDQIYNIFKYAVSEIIFKC
jgi:hypothetical protein